MNPVLIPPYNAPFGLKNAHLQNFLCSVGIRKKLLQKRHQGFIQSAREKILDAGEGVRLKAEFNGHKNRSSTLVILIHGWEGSSQSAYILSMAANLYAAGFDTLRLNLRDHGETTHLNQGIFNSTLIREVVGAIAHLQQETLYESYYLSGFSLGANFSLRVGLRHESLPKPLKKILAVSPLLDPAHTMTTMETAISYYDRYFVLKWKRTLKEKLSHFPEYDYREALEPMKSLREMHNYFIPRYCNFKKVEDYFQAYNITGKILNKMRVNTLILAAEDDPIIPASDFFKTQFSEHIALELNKHGSHCAFLENWKLESWLDRKAIEYFNQ